MSNYNVIDLGTLGGTMSHAQAVNNFGQVVGGAQVISGGASLMHPFLWTPGATDGVPSNPQMKDLGTLPGGYGHAKDLNDNGHVVGWSATDTQVLHAFLWQDGTMTDLQIASGNTGNLFLAINNSGVVVGEMATDAGSARAFVWQDLNANGQNDPGELQDLNDLGPSNLGAELRAATDVNDLGQIVAIGVVHGGGWQAYRLSDTNNDGAFLDAGEVTPLGASPSQAFAINNVGQVAGYSGDNAYRWQDGADKNLGKFNRGTPVPTDINSGGHVVGWGGGANGLDVRAWAWTGSGKILDLNGQIPKKSGWFLTEARGINDGGAIVGVGALSNASRAFRLTPTSGSSATTTVTTTSVTAATTQTFILLEPLVAEPVDSWLNAGIRGKKTKLAMLP